MTEATQAVGAIVQAAPSLSGLQRSRWWLAGLRQVIPWLRDSSLTCVWQTLRRLGLRYKRGRHYVHSPDPDYALKLAYVRAAENLARREPERYVVVYQDEMTYYRRPTLAQAYAPVGRKQPLAPSGQGANSKRRVCASLNFLTGHVVAHQRSSFDRRALLAHYRALEAAYPHVQTLFVVQDNWPVHFHPDILLALVGSRITLLRLPTYAPWTNPIEQVWRRLRQELLHLHPFVDDWPALQQAVDCWFDQWQQPSPDLLHYVGLTPY